MIGPEESPMQHWWKQFRDYALAIMSIYFDRIKSSAKSIYCFDPYLLGNTCKGETVNELIQDLLKRQEGHAIASFIVLNNTGNPFSNFECGFAQANHVNEPRNLFQEWPVCYFRGSTEHTTAILSTVNRSQSDTKGMKRTPNDSMSTMTQQFTTKSPTSPHGTSVIDAQSWPFSEWKELVSHLTCGGVIGSAVTYKARNNAERSEQGSEDIPLTPSTSSTRTAFHTVRLSTLLYMVVAVNGTDGNWNLRRSREPSDIDITTFLEDIVMKLMISSFFNDSNVETAKQGAKQASKLPVKEVDGDMQSFLKSMKSSYGLRPQSPMVERLKSPYSPSGARSTSKLGRRSKMRPGTVDMNESATAFFLGSALIDRFP